MGSHYGNDESFIDRREASYYAKVLAHGKLVRRVIEQADANADENYCGLIFSEVERRLGDQSNKTLTLAALDTLEVYKSHKLPTRYSLRKPEVKFVDKHLYGTVAKINRQPEMDGRSFATLLTTGRRDK